MTDEIEGVHPHLVGDGQDIGDQMRNGVIGDLCGAGPGRIAPLIRGHHPIARITQSRQLAIPAH